MFSIFSFMKLFTSLSLAFSPSIRGEAGDLGWKLGSRKGNVLHRRDSSDSYRVYRETTEGLGITLEDLSTYQQQLQGTYQFVIFVLSDDLTRIIVHTTSAGHTWYDFIVGIMAAGPGFATHRIKEGNLLITYLPDKNPNGGQNPDGSASHEYNIIGGNTNSFSDVLGSITAKATVTNIEGLVAIANQFWILEE